MAARLNRMHQDSVRARIKVSNIIDRLEKHVEGKIELTPAQVTSAKILLDKTISNAPTETVISGGITIEQMLSSLDEQSTTESSDTEE